MHKKTPQNKPNQNTLIIMPACSAASVSVSRLQLESFETLLELQIKHFVSFVSYVCVFQNFWFCFVITCLFLFISFILRRGLILLFLHLVCDQTCAWLLFEA